MTAKLTSSPRSGSWCGCAVVSWPGGRYATPAASSVPASNSTGSGVSVMAMNSSPSRETLTLPLSVVPGRKAEATRLNRERQGSVANSEKARRPVRSASL